MNKIAALCDSRICPPIIENSKNFIDIRIVVMTKSISDSRVAWRRLYGKMGRIGRNSGIKNNLRFSNSRILQEKAREANANYAVDAGKQFYLMKVGHLPVHNLLRANNAYSLRINIFRMRIDKICICLRTVALLFGNETWVLEESSSGP